MYAIQTDAHGERSFHYWRAQSAAKQWFSSERPKSQWLELLSLFGVFYLSGITLSLMTDAGRETLVAALQEWRARGGSSLVWPGIITGRFKRSEGAG